MLDKTVNGIQGLLEGLAGATELLDLADAEDDEEQHRIGIDAIRNTLGVVGTADRMMSGITEAGRSLIREVGGGGTGSSSTAAGSQSVTRPPQESPAPEPARRDIRIDE